MSLQDRASRSTEHFGIKTAADRWLACHSIQSWSSHLRVSDLQGLCKILKDMWLQKAAHRLSCSRRTALQKVAYFMVFFFLSITRVPANAPQLTNSSAAHRTILLVSPVFGLVVSPVLGLLSLGVVVAESDFQVAS